jgi:hypothetical protein
MKRFLLALLLAGSASAAHADSTINNLTPCSGLTGAESIPAFQTKNPACRTTPSAIKSFVGTPGGPPTGTASGDLTGMYPNPTLVAVNPNVGSFGSATQCVAFTTDAKGRITAASAVTCTPALAGITGLGAGVAAALAIAPGTAGGVVLYNGAGGTPSSLNLSNATNLPVAALPVPLPISVGGLGCSTYSTFSNANYTIQSTDCQAAQTGSLSAARTVTLPAASSFVAYRRLIVIDTSGTATTTNTISLAPNGTDQINGSNTTQVAINAGFGFVEIESDGVSKWTVARISLGSPLVAAGAVPVTNGGTGLSSGTSGGIPYYNSSSSMASTGALTNNGVMIGAGAGNAPTTIGPCSTTTVVHGQGAGSAPNCAQVAISSDVSGLGSGVATAAGNALSAAGGLTTTIASGTAALGTSAIASAACATVVTVAATNVATTDVVMASFNSDPTAVTGYIPSTSGMLTIFGYPTSGNVNFKVCNNTGGSITPGAITLNWRVAR